MVMPQERQSGGGFYGGKDRTRRHIELIDQFFRERELEGLLTFVGAQRALRDVGFPTTSQTLSQRWSELSRIQVRQSKGNSIGFERRAARRTLVRTQRFARNRFQYRGVAIVIDESTGDTQLFNFDFGSGINLTRRQIIDRVQEIMDMASSTGQRTGSISEGLIVESISLDAVLENISIA